MNKLRLEKLKIKIDCVTSVLEEVKSGLINRIKNKPEDYKHLMKDLIVQGLVGLLEEDIRIFCKKSDLALVTSLIEESKVAFNNLLVKESKMPKPMNVNIKIDNKFFLPETVYKKYF
jgi:vacuolar-type H+-ATPase subunit E/Vma4